MVTTKTNTPIPRKDQGASRKNNRVQSAKREIVLKFLITIPSILFCFSVSLSLPSQWDHCCTSHLCHGSAAAGDEILRTLLEPVTVDPGSCVLFPISILLLPSEVIDLAVLD
jgi:hypothetical protein